MKLASDLYRYQLEEIVAALQVYLCRGLRSVPPGENDPDEGGCELVELSYDLLDAHGMMPRGPVPGPAEEV